MKITAALVPEKGAQFVMRDLTLAEPQGNELRVRVIACGICHTDVSSRDQLYGTQMPAVLGHEGAGVVEAVGPDVKSIKPGDHVLMSFDNCGNCPSCQQGQIAYCWHHMEMNFSGFRYSGTAWDVPSPISMTGADGTEHAIGGAFFGQSSFASHAICTERNAVVIDKDLPLEVLAPLGCGMQTGAGAVLNTLKPAAGSSIVITGAGTVGMAAIMAAKIVGCNPIIAIDMSESRLALARELGATHTINPVNGDIVTAVKAISPNGVQYSIETTANPSVFRAAVDMLQVRGVCGLIGGAKPGTEVSFEMTHILFGRTIKGILQGDSVPKTFLPQLIELYRKGQFPIEKLEKTYPMDQINAAIADMKSGVTIKPVLLTGAQV